MPPLPFCCFVPGAGDESAHFSFRHAEGWGRFALPGARDEFHPPFSFRLAERTGTFRAPARGPFGAAQKGRKGRLGAAAPKNPIDVHWSALFSFRRVDIVLPLRPLPGLPLR